MSCAPFTADRGEQKCPRCLAEGHYARATKEKGRTEYSGNRYLRPALSLTPFLTTVSNSGMVMVPNRLGVVVCLTPSPKGEKAAFYFFSAENVHYRMLSNIGGTTSSNREVWRPSRAGERCFAFFLCLMNPKPTGGRHGC